MSDSFPIARVGYHAGPDDRRNSQKQPPDKKPKKARSEDLPDPRDAATDETEKTPPKSSDGVGRHIDLEA